MNAPGLVVVTLEAGCGGELPLPVARRVVAAEASSPEDLARATDLEQATVLWLPPWSRLDARAAADVLAWMERARVAAPGDGLAAGAGGSRARAGAGPRVARARVRLSSGEATLQVAEPRIVLSSPGAVDLAGDVPVARTGAAVDDLATPWEGCLPPSLGEHLEAVNRQSSVTARLRFASGRRPAWRDLVVTPGWFVIRGMAGVEGSLRAALPRLVIEGYREVLVSAKLWELARGAGAA